MTEAEEKTLLAQFYGVCFWLSLAALGLSIVWSDWYAALVSGGAAAFSRGMNKALSK